MKAMIEQHHVGNCEGTHVMEAANVTDIAALQDILADHSGDYVHRIRLSLPQLEPTQLLLWERRINKLLAGRCGCSEGTAGLLTGAGLLVASILIGWPRGIHGLGLAAMGTLLIVVSACVGKLAGKTRNRWKTRRLVADLSILLEALPGSRSGTRPDPVSGFGSVAGT
jgi:hypothetical protein